MAAIQAVPHATVQAWRALLESLEGRPGWVVGDGGHPLRAATMAWAQAEATEGPSHDLVVDLGEDPASLHTWRCEWHLARNISQALPAQITEDRTDRIHQLFGDAVRSAAGWQRLCDELSKRIRGDGTCRGAMNSLLHIRDVVARDGHCRFPNCTRPPMMCHAHHVIHWIDGGPTSLANMILLCGHHHRLVHAGPWTITRTGPAQVAFDPPPGTRREPPTPRPPPVE